MSRVSDYLLADHDLLGALLDASRSGGRFDPEAFARFRAGLLRHIAIEERLLLPAARQAGGGAPLPGARQLRIEHGAIASLLVPPPDLALCGEVSWLLARHEPREEGPDGIYAECEARLGPAASRALLLRARDHRPVRVAPHRDWPTVLRTAADALASAARMYPGDPGGPPVEPGPA